MSDVIEPLRFFNIQKVLPAVYGDELSYYELLAKMEQKINEEVGSINNQNVKLALMQKAIDDFTAGGYKDDFEEFLDTWFAENLDTIEQYLQDGFGGELDEIRESITTSQEQTLDTVADEYVPFPVAPASKYGTDGQVLRTNGDGSTQWQAPLIPTDQQAETYINAWLNEHPEATTTVADNSLTNTKFMADQITDDKLKQIQLVQTVKNAETLLQGLTKYLANAIDHNKNKYTGFSLKDRYVGSDGTVLFVSGWNLTDYISVDGYSSVTYSALTIATNTRSLQTPYYLATYDADFNFIESKGATPSSTYTVESGVKYIRFSYHPSDVKDIQVESGTGRTAYTPFNFKVIDELIGSNSSRISNIENDRYDKATPIVYEFGIGKVIAANGNIVNFTSQLTVSELIDVSPYTTLILNVGVTYANLGFAFYDANETFISGGATGNGTSSIKYYTDLTVSVPSNAKYIRVCGITSNNAQIAYISKSLYPKSNLNGKKVCVIGDSITEKNRTAEYNWAYYLKMSTNCVVQNLGISGTGFWRSNPYVNRISSIAQDVDIIGVAISFNDIGHGKDVGTYQDTIENDTICGYANQFITSLLAAFPSTPIIVYSQGPWSAYRYGGTLQSGTALITEITKMFTRLGVPVYSDLYMNGSALRPWNTDNQNVYYKNENTGELDITHPNSAGHKIIANYLIQKFEQNICEV